MNRKLFLAPVLLSMAVAGCDGLLDEEPRSFLTIENYYQTADEARSAVMAAYKQINTTYIAGWQWMFPLEGMSDVANAHPADQNPPAQHPSTLQWDAANTHMTPHWTNLFRLIYRANLGLERVPGSPLTDAEEADAVAELKFLRGWAYLELNKRYGDLPLFLSTAAHATASPVRAPSDEVHAQIIKDLTEAEAALPLNRAKSEWGRATKGAARMVLADVYIWRSSRYNKGEWQQAANWAKTVIDSNQYRLLEDQIDVFLPSNKANEELIFAMPATGTQNRTSSSVQAAHYPREITPGGGYAVVNPTKWSYESFIDGDYRLETSFRFAACNLTRTTCFDPLPMGPHPYKFRPSNQTSNLRGDVDIPFYRYAETLLYYAEALNELGQTDEAIRYVNMVRARARGGVDGAESRSEPADLPMGLSKLAARDAIYMERHYELIWEVKRWWDLVRRDTLEPGYLVAQLTAHDPVSYSQGPIQEYRKLWPIPQRDIDISQGSLTQNPGY